jgi:two-component system cell cycle sensor histidine kinase/response regulator CckA
MVTHGNINSLVENKEISTSVITKASTVLLVDDDPFVVRLMARALRSTGLNVLEANSGEEALKIIHEVQKVDLVISDVNMPGMSGSQLMGIVRRNWPNSKFLFCSGYPEQFSAKGWRDVECNIMQKPFSASLLTSRVSAIINS